MKRKYFPAFIGIIFLLYLIISALVKMNKIEQNIQNNKYETTGKVYKFVNTRTSNRYYFTYYYNGKKYRGSNNIGYFNGNASVGRYYKVDLSSENPLNSIIFLDQEVTDSIEIVNAGFIFK